MPLSRRRRCAGCSSSNNAQDEKAKLDVDIQELKRRKHHFLQDVKKVIEMHREMVTFEEAGGVAKEEPAQE